MRSLRSHDSITIPYIHRFIHYECYDSIKIPLFYRQSFFLDVGRNYLLFRTVESVFTGSPLESPVCPFRSSSFPTLVSVHRWTLVVSNLIFPHLLRDPVLPCLPGLSFHEPSGIHTPFLKQNFSQEVFPSQMGTKKRRGVGEGTITKTTRHVSSYGSKLNIKQSYLRIPVSLEKNLIL